MSARILTCLLVSYFGAYGSANSTVKKAFLERLDTEPPEETGLDLDLWIFCHLQRVQNMDVKRGVLSLEMQRIAIWTIKNLSWVIDDPNGYSSVGIPEERVWKPQTGYLNRASPEEFKSSMPVEFGNKGNVYHVVSSVAHLVCMPRMRWFPFDEHECLLQVGVWNLQNAVFNRQGDRTLVITSDWFFKDNPYWKLISAEDNSNINFKSPGLDIPMLTSSLIIRRTAPILAVGLLCPILASSVLGLASFCLPPTHSCRMAMVLTASLLVAYTLQYLHLVIGSGHGETPIIGDFSATCHILLFVSCLQSVLVSLLAGLKSTPPKVIVKIIGAFPIRLLQLWGLAEKNSDLHGGNDENNLLQETSSLPDSTSISWLNVVVVLDELSLFVHIVILFVITCSAIITV